MSASSPEIVVSRPRAGCALVADIGGTNARFALAQLSGGRLALSDIRVLPTREYATPEAAVAAYLAEIPRGQRPRIAVLAVAGPVDRGEMRFTNLNWHLREAAMRDAGGFEQVRLINDFGALALSVPSLGPDDTRQIGPDVEGRADGTVAMLGPGTGFGVSALVRGEGSEQVLSTEGGHAGFAPCDDLEAAIWQRLRSQFGRVSIERVLSGPGLLSLYRAMCALEMTSPTLDDPASITRAAAQGDWFAALVADRFCAILGAVAGDIALGFGARGGVYIAGGIVPKLVDRLQNGAFRSRFESKGRFTSYMQSIPTYVVTNEQAALLGAGRAAMRMLAASPV